MISISQVKAARALLDIKQAELADMAGVSITAVNNMERQIGSPRLDTIMAIQGALEQAGIEFLEDDGVKRKGEVFEFLKFEGAHIIEKLTDDMLTHIQDGDEVIMCGIDERRFVALDEKQVQRYAQGSRNKNMRERILSRHGDKYFVSPASCYRWVSPDLFGRIPYIVYNDRVVFMLWEKPYRCIIIRNPSLAETFKTQFEFLWESAAIHGVQHSDWENYPKE